MIKKFLVIVLCTLLFAPAVYACDPLGCLFGGDDQDILVLGEVVTQTEDSIDMKIFFVFPQSHVQSIKEDNRITVKNLTQTMNFTEEESKAITVGKKYLMSLNKKINFYVPAWGIYEVTGTDYQNVKLVKNESIEDDALQIFINSGGTERSFGFDYGGDKPVLIFNGVRQERKEQESQIPPSYYIAGIGIGTLALVGGLVILSRRKGNKHTT